MIINRKKINYIFIQVIIALLGIVLGKLIAIQFTPLEYGEFNIQFDIYTIFFTLFITPLFQFKNQILKHCYQKLVMKIIAVDPRYFRPTEVELLIGDHTKSQTKLGWKPKYDLTMLVEDMMQSDLKLMQRELFLHDSNYDVIFKNE